MWHLKNDKNDLIKDNLKLKTRISTLEVRMNCLNF